MAPRHQAMGPHARNCRPTITPWESGWHIFFVSLAGVLLEISGFVGKVAISPSHEAFVRDCVRCSTGLNACNLPGSRHGRSPLGSGQTIGAFAVSNLSRNADIQC